MPETGVNPFKKAAQLEKAAIIVRLFRRFRGSVDHIDRMDKKDWAIVAEAAGVRMPSEEVREMVRKEMEF